MNNRTDSGKLGENDAATCQQIDTDLTRKSSLKVLKKLAARYESADAYNKPAIAFYLRRPFGHYLSDPGA